MVVLWAWARSRSTQRRGASRPGPHPEAVSERYGLHRRPTRDAARAGEPRPRLGASKPICETRPLHPTPRRPGHRVPPSTAPYPLRWAPQAVPLQQGPAPARMAALSAFHASALASTEGVAPPHASWRQRGALRRHRPRLRRRPPGRHPGRWQASPPTSHNQTSHRLPRAAPRPLPVVIPGCTAHPHPSSAHHRAATRLTPARRTPIHPGGAGPIDPPLPAPRAQDSRPFGLRIELPVPPRSWRAPRPVRFV